VVDEPVDQATIAPRVIGDSQRGNLAAAVIQQRDSMAALVNVDTDDHQGGLLARE